MIKKSFAFLLFTILFVSCSTTKTNYEQATTSAEALKIDFISDETLMRLSPKTQHSFKNHYTYTCHQKKYKENFANFLKAYPKNEKNPDFWNAVGTCYMLRKQYQQAVFYYKVGLSFDNKNEQILNNLAYIDLAKGNKATAYDKFKNLERSSLKVPRLNLAKLHYAFGNFEASNQILTNLSKHTTKDDEINGYMARNYTLLKNYTQAAVHIKRLSPAYYKKHGLSLEKSFGLMKMGQFTRAQKVLGSSRLPSSNLKNSKIQLSNLIKQKIQIQKNIAAQKQVAVKKKVTVKNTKSKQEKK